MLLARFQSLYLGITRGLLVASLSLPSTACLLCVSVSPFDVVPSLGCGRCAGLAVFRGLACELPTPVSEVFSMHVFVSASDVYSLSVSLICW